MPPQVGMKMDRLRVFDPDGHEGYGNWPLPSSADDEVENALAALTPDDARRLSADEADVLVTFAERMAILARRSGDPERLRAGLAAASAASTAEEEDEREVILILSLLWRSAEVLGLDAESEFLAAAERFDRSRAWPLTEFPERSPRDRPIEVMGYSELDDEFGFRYERNW